ncbi:MAG TPA: response regulator [Segetibacter sp.]|jgi:PleD family two-component response regulator
MVPEILIVEDDIDESMQLEEIFKENGYFRIQSFDNAFTFISYLNQNESSLPKVVILDYQMPKITGFQLLAFLKRNPKFTNIKVILYSGFDGSDYKSTCLKAGATDYVKKLSTYGELTQFALKVRDLAETGVYSK